MYSSVNSPGLGYMHILTPASVIFSTLKEVERDQLSGSQDTVAPKEAARSFERPASNDRQNRCAHF